MKVTSSSSVTEHGCPSGRPSTARLTQFAWLIALLLMVRIGTAYPPAPHHLIYGSVRDEMGNPLAVTNAEVILETLGGVQLNTAVAPNLEPGINYRLPVPMDAGLTADAYKPTALKPTLPFRMKVKLGGVTYLPLEMTGAYVNLGKPAQSTRLDLTLGEDTDGDGLPDAWERSLMTGGMTLRDINPGDDSDADGISNLQEYLAGTYAFDPQDGLRLDLIPEGDRHLIEFLAITGRSYTVQGSMDGQTWAPVPFRLAGEGSEAPARGYYQAGDVRRVRLEVLPANGKAPDRLFLRAQVH